MSRPFRSGFQLSGEHAADPVTAARHAEELGFDVVLVSDHVGPGLAPMTTLAAIAAVTERIRLGTLVLNNDMRNPVQVAWEAVSLDRLSGGRSSSASAPATHPRSTPRPASRSIRRPYARPVSSSPCRFCARSCAVRELVTPVGTQHVHENDVARAGVDVGDLR